jgi:hypothetical protein
MGPFATHRTISRIALASAHIFSWLFLFQYFFVVSASLLYSLIGIAAAYALCNVVAILLTPYTAGRLRHGVRGMLVNAQLSLALAFAVLAACFAGLLPVSIGIIGFSIGLALYRALYWIPYEIATRHLRRGKFSEIAAALVPALAGMYLMSAPTAPLMLLSIAAVLSLTAIVPLYAVKNTQEGFSWSYRGTFSHLFTAAHRVPLLQAILNGFEGAALLLLWPIAMFVLLDWSYALLGIVFSFTLLCTLLVRHLIGKHHALVQTPVIHSVLSISGWVLRGTVAAPFAFVLVDASYHSGAGSDTRGIDLLTYEQTADSNSYIDEFTALKDMGQGIGRLLFCIAIIVIGPLTTFAALTLGLFIAAAFTTLASVYVSRAIARHAF